MASSSKNGRSNEEESSRFECRLVFNFRSFIPVVGIEFNPHIHVQRPFSGVIPKGPKHVIHCNWFRKISSSLIIDRDVCCIHPDKLAIVQCKYCAALDIPVQNSCYCCTDCFSSDWNRHTVYHPHAGEAVNPDNEKAGTEHRICGAREAVQFLDQGNREWTLVGNLNSYVPTLDDFGSILKLVAVAVDIGTESQLTDVNHIETQAVILPPVSYPRRMINFRANDTKSTLEHVYSDGLAFSVMSYNVLADLYVFLNSEAYKCYCESWALVWEYRRQKILDEIIEYDADIICLQEVQTDHYKNFFEPAMQSLGYTGLHKKKESITSTYLTGDDGERIFDGCAMFYRANLFRLIDKVELEYAEMARALNQDASYHLGRENIAHVALLQFTGVGKSYCHSVICVANTHIVANPRLKDAKLFQIGSFVNYLEHFTNSRIPLLICGDFNTEPSSDPYKLVVHGRCDPSFDATQDRFRVSNLIKLNHNINLASAYSSFPLLHGTEELHKKMNIEAREPRFTNRTPNYTGTLDYIFYTVNHLRVEGLLDLLDPESKSLASFLPSRTMSSDHICLVAKFRLIRHFPQPRKVRTMRRPPYMYDARNMNFRGFI